MDKIKIGIIICDRYNGCTGGKCFRAIKEKSGAFEIHNNREIEITGFTTCGGCPGGNIEYAPEEFRKNGTQVIHFATGMVVGYPPCPYIDYFKQFIESKFGIQVVVGTHPIPEKYFSTHSKLNTWEDEKWNEFLQPILSNKEIRQVYD